jgi:hypothetical protein
MVHQFLLSERYNGSADSQIKLLLNASKTTLSLNPPNCRRICGAVCYWIKSIDVLI